MKKKRLHVEKSSVVNEEEEEEEEGLWAAWKVVL